MRLVSIDMITPEMKIARAIYQQGTLILPEGRDDVTKFIPSLRNMGIEYVYVEDGKSAGIEIPDAIAERTRINCKQILQETIQQFSLTDKLETKELEACVNKVVADILENPGVQVSLNDIASNDEYTYTHSVSTMVYALMIARRLNYSEQMMSVLGMGALLHDIGKMLIDQEVMFKTGGLSQQEYEYVKKHSTYGYQALRRIPTVPEQVCKIAYMHHERLDGSGYPQGLCGEEINEYIRIVSIADVYDALTTDRCYRKKWPANRAMEFLMMKSSREFDPRLVGVFAQQLAVYPNGSMVKLSNQHIAIVSRQNQSMPLRPVVRVIQNAEGEDIVPYELDLMRELCVTITESELEINRNQPPVSPYDI